MASEFIRQPLKNVQNLTLPRSPTAPVDLFVPEIKTYSQRPKEDRVKQLDISTVWRGLYYKELDVAKAILRRSLQLYPPTLEFEELTISVFEGRTYELRPRCQHLSPVGTSEYDVKYSSACYWLKFDDLRSCFAGQVPPNTHGKYRIVISASVKHRFRDGVIHEQILRAAIDLRILPNLEWDYANLTTKRPSTARSLPLGALRKSERLSSKWIRLGTRAVSAKDWAGSEDATKLPSPQPPLLVKTPLLKKLVTSDVAGKLRIAAAEAEIDPSDLFKPTPSPSSTPLKTPQIPEITESWFPQVFASSTTEEWSEYSPPPEPHNGKSVTEYSSSLQSSALSVAGESELETSNRYEVLATRTDMDRPAISSLFNVVRAGFHTDCERRRTAALRRSTNTSRESDFLACHSITREESTEEDSGNRLSSVRVRRCAQAVQDINFGSGEDPRDIRLMREEILGNELRKMEGKMMRRRIVRWVSSEAASTGTMSSIDE